MKLGVRLSEKTIGVGLVLAFGLIAVLPLLALPTRALADTIQLEVSPSMPRPGYGMTITAFGSASSKEDQISIVAPPPGEVCPAQYSFEEVWPSGWKLPTPWFAWATSPTFSQQFVYFESIGPTVCGYLTYQNEHLVNEVWVWEHFTLATATLPITYGPSIEEENAKSTKEREQREHEEAAKRKYEEEAPQRQAAKEAAEAQAKRAAEAKSKELAEQAPVGFLHVAVISHRLGSYAHPGASDIAYETSKYAHVVITINHSGGTHSYRASGEPKHFTFNWSCHQSGLTYHYVVTAVGGSGPTLSRAGHFRSVSAKWCANAKRREAAEGAQEAHEQAREQADHPAQTALEHELKRTYKILANEQKIDCYRTTDNRYKCSWEGVTEALGLAGTYGYCESPRGTAVVTISRDGTEVTVSFSGRYQLCSYPY